MSTVLDVAQYLTQVRQDAEQWVEKIGLTPVEVLSQYALTQGEINGNPVSLSSFRYQGHCFSSLTLAYMKDQHDKILSVTLVGLPVKGSPLPIFGADYVGFRRSLSLIALDLCPTDQEFWEQYTQPFLSQMRSESGLVQRKMPGFTQDVFSQEAICAAAVNSEQCDKAVDLFSQALSHYEALYEHYLQGQSRSGEDESTARYMQGQEELIKRWMLTMQSNKKEHSALSRILGESFTEKYLKEFLFYLEVF